MKTIKLHETATLLALENFEGNSEDLIQIYAGSKLVVTIMVTALDPGATLQVELLNGFNASLPFSPAASFLFNAPGTQKQIVTDFHNLFKLIANVTGGTTTLYVAASVLSTPQLEIKDLTLPPIEVTIPPFEIIRSQAIESGELSLQSLAFTAQTTAIQLFCDYDCYVQLGPNPVASVASIFVPAGIVLTYKTVPGDKLAAVQANDPGTLRIVEGKL